MFSHAQKPEFEVPEESSKGSASISGTHMYTHVRVHVHSITIHNVHTVCTVYTVLVESSVRFGSMLLVLSWKMASVVYTNMCQPSLEGLSLTALVLNATIPEDHNYI